MTSTYFALLAEFGTAEIPLERMCEKFFGMAAPEAKRRAARQQLPVPAHRVGGQKSGWLVSAADLAEHIDRQRAAAAEAWSKMQAA